MRLHKTDQARRTLADNTPGALTLQQRRILILTDGMRSINDIMAMLGDGILPDVDVLIRAGFLSTSHASATGRPGADRLGQRLRGAASLLASSASAMTRNRGADTPDRVVVHAPAAPAPTPPQAPAPASRASGTTRRSLAASKMYVMDLLQMQRDPLIAECRTEIQCAQDEAAVVVALLDGVRHLIPRVSPGMTARVVAHLDDILPAPYLPALRSLESEITGKPVLAITNVA